VRESVVAPYDGCLYLPRKQERSSAVAWNWFQPDLSAGWNLAFPLDGRVHIPVRQKNRAAAISVPTCRPMS
jgi:hypothetical protein